MTLYFKNLYSRQENFDKKNIAKDLYCKEATWEEAEMNLMRNALSEALRKGMLQVEDLSLAKEPGEESKRPSVETTLHSLFEYTFVLHLHPALVNGLTCSQNGKEKAKELFESGYNCSQAVLLAFADMFGMDFETAQKISATFGGGMGRMREVCGAVSGMTMLAGMIRPASDPTVKDWRTANYALVQDLAAQFKAENGSLICSELLGIAPKPQEPTPEARTEAYYQKRPCADMVASAVRIYLESLD